MGSESRVARAGILGFRSSFPPATKKRRSSRRCNTLLALDYDNYEVIAVNDRSTDRPGEIMERVAESSSQNPHPVAEIAARWGTQLLRVIHHTELPAGWLGKTHAMWTAANQATGEWLLFTDADVLFKT